jgi:uncharacterized membrane protein YeaQ/YmgE (transglycosylase-associated protein family)
VSSVIWIGIGGTIGWIASLLMYGPTTSGLWMNIVTGISGALLGGWVISPQVVGTSVNEVDFSALGLVISIGTAILVLVIVNFMQRRADPESTPSRRHSSP